MSGSRRRALPPWDRGRQVAPWAAGWRKAGWFGDGSRVDRRRLVGIDLGIASAHTVRVLDGSGREVCRRRCEPSVASLTLIEQVALAGASQGTRLEVVMEPT